MLSDEKELYLHIIYIEQRMKFKEVVSYYQIPTASDVGVAYWKITSNAHIEKDAPTIEVHTILLVIEGTLRISVRGKKYSLNRGCFSDVMGGDHNLKLISASHDINAICFLLTEEYAYSLFRQKPPFPHSYAFEIRKNPVYIIEEREIPRLIHCLDDIRQTLEDKQHHYQIAMLRYRIWILLMENADIYLKGKRELPSETDNSRKSKLFLNFVTQIPLHIRQEHTVEFYASLLCVTPQYLRRVVRECSGKTASQWINEELLREICKLLAETTISVQEIAEKLNFSDLSVMSKFFKRHKGISPLGFRNEHEK